MIETLGFRHIGVVHDEYAISPDGMKAFGVLDLGTEMEGCRFSIGLRNSLDKSMRLAMTCGYCVFVCLNMAFAGDFTPVTMLAIIGRCEQNLPFGATIQPKPGTGTSKTSKSLRLFANVEVGRTEIPSCVRSLEQVPRSRGRCLDTV